MQFRQRPHGALSMDGRVRGFTGRLLARQTGHADRGSGVFLLAEARLQPRGAGPRAKLGEVTRTGRTPCPEKFIVSADVTIKNQANTTLACRLYHLLRGEFRAAHV
jgi:hypothetical protein